ncbi:MAG TPA: protein kinase [Polyangiaceae bacterium]|jgi:serine/threonine-protein kinase|nr:protein kinase [Polyangiaceae bacterium]
MSPTPAREEDTPEIVGSVLAGRYRVERLLGEGGMGRVYLAQHVLMKKPVALKVLHPEMTAIPEIVARFEREAVAAARIDHANVAQAMDFGRLDDGSLYFVLEYVDGRSLRALLEAGALPLGRALSIARQVASALVAAHQVGIVHRDLKPDNVMLVEQPDGTDRVKVLDFGIAKLTAGDGEAAVPGKTLTRVGVVMGTVGYMAPEQALGQAVSHLADIYAFGSMLYEMLAGHLPFVADDITVILTKQLTEDPPPLPESVPAELARLIERLLARNAADRVQTAAELLETLDAISRRRMVAVAPTAFLTEPMDASSLSGRLAVAHTMPGTTKSGPRLWLAAGALVVAGFVGFAALRTHGGEAPSPSSEPSGAPPMAAAQSANAVETPAPSESSPGTLPPVDVSPPPAVEPKKPEPKKAEPAPERSVNGKTKRTKRTHVTEEHTVRRTRHRGIYIPPPSQWFH